MSKFNLRLFFVLLGLLLVGATTASADEVTMRIVFQNPSELEDKVGVVKSYLPPEIEKEHVLETGQLELDYDPGKDLFYVFADISLSPKESRTYSIKVSDVWKIPVEELEFIQRQVDDHLETLIGSDDYEAAELLHQKVVKILSQIKTTQDLQQGDVAQRMESFRVNTQRLRTIRSHVILMKDFKQEAETEADSIKAAKEIRFVIRLNNPSENERKEEVIRYLPEGVTPDLIDDTQGFDIKFDVDKKLYYLSSEVTMQPKEDKVIKINIKDRWYIPESKLGGFEEKAMELVDFLKDSEFKDPSLYLMSEINRFLKEIKTSQSSAVTIKDRIGNYAENTKRVEAIRLNIVELQRMAEILKERQRQQTLEELLKKLAPDEVTTWRIIYATIVFLAIISMLTYVLWWGASKKKLTEEYKDISSEDRVRKGALK